MGQTVSLTLSDSLILSSADVDGWITNKGTVYNTQWIDCSYPISGGYERTPRYLFYTLIMVSFLGRKLPMVTGVALGSIMVYSGTAAVHALALFIIRHGLWPEPSYNGGAPEIVLTGTFTDPGNLTALESTWTPLDLVTAGSWFPLVPMAWDSDNDAVLAITGVAFLVIAPMQAWSKTFRNANAKAVLLWSSLLLFGVVLALISEEIITNHTFPQLRFCPRNFNDTLPMTNGARDSLAGVWDRQNLFRWNTTITNIFSNTTGRLSTACIYPCFETSWPLKSRSEIVASPIKLTTFPKLYFRLTVAVYFVFGSAAISSLTVFLAKTWKRGILRSHRSRNMKDFKENWIKLLLCRPNFSLFKSKLLLTAIWDLYLHAIEVWAGILSIPALLLFIGWIEWTIFMDQPGESISHIGQWGVLVGTSLVLIAANVEYIREKLKTKKQLLNPRNLNQRVNPSNNLDMLQHPTNLGLDLSNGIELPTISAENQPLTQNSRVSRAMTWG